MKKRNTFINAIEIILMVLICIFLFWQNTSSIKSQTNKDMTRELSGLIFNFREISDKEDRAYENYLLVERHIARLAVYYLDNTKGPLSEKKMASLLNLLEKDGIYVLDSNGNILLSCGRPADKDVFSGDALSHLLDISEDRPFSDIISSDDTPVEKKEDAGDNALKTDEVGTGFLPDEIHGLNEASEAEAEINPFADIEKESEALSLYQSCYMDSGHILVVRDNFSNYTRGAAVRNSVYDIIEKSRYGKNGFYFIVSKDGQVLYDPRDKESAGLKDSRNENSAEKETKEIPHAWLSDGASQIISLDGNKYFCTSCQYLGEADYIVCALPIKELFFTILFFSMSSIAVVIFSLFIMRLYAQMFFLESSKTKDSELKKNSFRSRLFVLMILCVCATAGVNIYCHTLYLYSSAISSDKQKAGSLQEAIASINTLQEYGSEDYRYAVKSFTRIAASLVSSNPEYTDQKKLAELAEILGAAHILIYDNSGTVVSSDQNYPGLSLSQDPEELSNAFRWVLYGEPLLIQDQVDKTYLHKPYLFSGAQLKDEKNIAYGLVQLAFSPSFRDKMVSTTSIGSILSSLGEWDNTCALAVETATGIVHSSLDSLDGLQAEDVGLTDDNLKDEFVGFLNIQNEQGIGCCEKSGDYWVILASSTDEIPIIGLRTGFLAALSGILTEFLFFAFMLIGDNKYFHLQAEEEKSCLTEGKQETSKAEHHVLRFVNLAAIFVSGLVTFFTFAGRVLFQKNTVGYYIFVYPWSKGLNIFTINRILIYICVIIFVMSILLKLLSLLASLLPSRQETVVRLLLSFVKYSGLIGAVYFCMTLLGVPTSSLLASAGALTVIFSIGAQSIVADILAGLFIIFEGSFKVGDMITVEDWHGQVVEIGIRNTRIRDLISSDVKIMNNSTIKKVINYSTTPSFCHVTIGIEYGFDLEEIDAIIEKEKPVIKKNIPLMLGDLVYLGVDEFADSAVILKFQAACRNQDDLKVRRALNRELKLMFDRNGINVPFPQIVLNERE